MASGRLRIGYPGGAYVLVAEHGTYTLTGFPVNLVYSSNAEYGGFTPTIYAAANALGNGSGSSEANAMALSTAITVATAGDVVGILPGTCTIGRAAANDTPAWNPTNSGTALNPIRFVGKYDPTAMADPGSNANRTELRHSGGTNYNTGSAGPLFGANSRNYIYWINIYCDEQFFFTRSDNGPAYVFNCTGSGFERCVIRCVTVAWADNHNGIRFGEGTPNSTTSPFARNCKIYGARVTGTSTHNGAGLMMYGTTGALVEHCYFENCGAGIFPKGADNHNFTIRFNRTRLCSKGIRNSFSAATGASRIYQNLVDECAIGIDIDDSSRNLTVDFNTIYGDPASAGLYSDNAASWSALVVRDNLVTRAGTGELVTMGEITVVPTTMDRQAYYNFGSTNRWSHNFVQYTSITNWRTATSRDANSQVLTADPFVAVASQNFRLNSTAGGGLVCATLASDGGPVGCYRTGTEDIGVEP